MWLCQETKKRGHDVSSRPRFILIGLMFYESSALTFSITANASAT
jgi:hypothetical protein